MVVGAQRVTRFGPRREHVAHVGTRVTEGADLPVEHRADVARVVDDAVAETEVAVDHGALGLRRDARRQQRVHAVDGRHVARLGGFELRVPPLELAGHELVAPRQVAEADRVDVDRVERHERIDQRFAAVGSRGAVELGDGSGVVVEHDPLDVRHHVERGADDVDVVAVRERVGDGHRGRTERGDDAVLAAHVVRGGQHAVQRGSAHDQFATGRVAHVAR